MTFDDFFKTFHHLRFVTLGIWVAILVVCFVFFGEFIPRTNVKFTPPKNSKADKATSAYKKLFPDTYDAARFVVLMRLRKNSTEYPTILSNGWANQTTFEILHYAQDFHKDKNFFNPENAMGYYTFQNHPLYDPTDPMTQFFLTTSFVSQSGKSTIMVLATKEKATQKSLQWVEHMRDKMKKIDKKKGTFSLDIIGFDTLTKDMIDGTEKDLEKMDSISLPVALVIFIVILRSLSVAIIPCIAVIASILVSFTIMVPITYLIDVPSFAPAIMMSVTIAMSIDYCLFLLTRFHEELNNRNPPMAAARNMLRYSGETIAKSGSVFLVCLASLIVFPLDIIVATGVAAVVALASTMIVALTLIPTVICIGLNFFAVRGIIPCIQRNREGKFEARCMCPCGKNAYRMGEAGDEYLSKKEKFEKEKRGIWFRWSNFMTNKKCAAITAIVVVAFMVPFCCGMIAFDYVINQNHVLPRDSPTHDAIDRFEKDWSVGQLYTFDIIICNKVSKAVPIFDPVTFDMMHNLALDIDAFSDNYDIRGILSPTDINGMHISFQDAYSNLTQHKFAYSLVYKLLVNDNMTGIRMSLATVENPNINASRVPLDIRPILDRYQDKYNYSIYLASPLVDMHDSVVYTYQVYMYIILAICVIIVFMVIIAFQAPILAFQMIFTIALTVVWAYGVVTVLFGTSWFHWLSHYIKDDPGENWIIPVMPLPVLIGLALDYNIFLFTRIHEFRAHGWAPRAAIIRGVSKSTVVILYAGVIMAVAFSGLLFSGLMIMNQFGVLLALGVLLDTFLITTTLNPALVFLMNHLAYWPRKFPIKYENPEVFNKEAEVDNTGPTKPTRDIGAIGEGSPLTQGLMQSEDIVYDTAM